MPPRKTATAIGVPARSASRRSRRRRRPPSDHQTSARYWGGAENVPTRALTVGMRELLASRETLLLASGATKRAIVRRALLGAVTPEVPASFLQGAERVTAVVDRAAWCSKDDA